MYFIYIIVDTFVHGLDPAMNKNLSLDLIGLVLADEAFDLLDEFTGLPLRNKLRALDCIDQELHLCQFELSDAHMVIGLSSDLFFYDC